METLDKMVPIPFAPSHCVHKTFINFYACWLADMHLYLAALSGVRQCHRLRHGRMVSQIYCRHKRLALEQGRNCSWKLESVGYSLWLQVGAVSLRCVDLYGCDQRVAGDLR